MTATTLAELIFAEPSKGKLKIGLSVKLFGDPQ